MTTTGKRCSDCGRKRAVSREGWCLRCLRKRLREKFGPVPYLHAGESRTADQRQAHEYE